MLLVNARNSLTKTELWGFRISKMSEFSKNKIDLNIYLNLQCNTSCFHIFAVVYLTSEINNVILRVFIYLL